MTPPEAWLVKRSDLYLSACQMRDLSANWLFVLEAPQLGLGGPLPDGCELLRGGLLGNWAGFESWWPSRSACDIRLH